MRKKLTYQEILGAFDAFANDLALAKLGWKLSLYVSRNIDFLRLHMDHYNKAQGELVEEHSVETKIMEEGKEVTRKIVSADKVFLFRKEGQELLDTEIEIEYDSINVDSLAEKDKEKFDDFVTPKIVYNINYTFDN
jgi:hypothetical protein